MPTYDYECLHCGHTFEYFQAMSDDPLKECPQCGKEVRRLIGGGLGIIFKGSGFYVTDNRKSASAGSQTASKSEETKTASTKSEKKSEASGTDNSSKSKEKTAKTP